MPAQQHRGIARLRCHGTVCLQLALDGQNGHARHRRQQARRCPIHPHRTGPGPAGWVVREAERITCGRPLFGGGALEALSDRQIGSSWARHGGCNTPIQGNVHTAAFIRAMCNGPRCDSTFVGFMILFAAVAHSGYARLADRPSPAPVALAAQAQPVAAGHTSPDGLKQEAQAGEQDQQGMEEPGDH